MAWVATILVAVFPFRSRAGGFLPESTGLRFGIAPTAENFDFHQGEAFADWNLPWRCDLGAKMTLQTRLDASAGWFGRGAEGAGIFGAGPFLALGRTGLPLQLEAGANVTGITRTQFVGKNFGDPVQFTSYAGLYWDFLPHFRVGCRFQHMSNASLNQHNPGINLIMAGVSYVF